MKLPVLAAIIMVRITANSMINNGVFMMDLKLLAGFNNATMEYPENNDNNVINMISKL